jgi:nucleotide-binding universal stress UspA family protein
MFKNCQVLYPTDFSPNAEYARAYAAAFAKTFGGRVHVAHVVDVGVASGGAFGLRDADLLPLLDAMDERAKAQLESIENQLKLDGVDVVTHIQRGTPADTLVNMIEKHGCTLMVVSTHGRRGFDRLVFGSVAERLLRLSPVPVLSIKHPEHEFVRGLNGNLEIKKILYPTDFSPFSEKGLPFAVSICREFGAALTLTYVHEYPIGATELVPEGAAAVNAEMEKTARDLLSQWKSRITEVPVETELRMGSPYREVSEMVKEQEFDLVVMPTHGRSGVAHMFLGSVAERIARHAPCPVLTIRPEMP